MQSFCTHTQQRSCLLTTLVIETPNLLAPLVKLQEEEEEEEEEEKKKRRRRRSFDSLSPVPSRQLRHAKHRTAQRIHEFATGKKPASFLPPSPPKKGYAHTMAIRIHCHSSPTILDLILSVATGYHHILLPASSAPSCQPSAQHPTRKSVSSVRATAAAATSPSFLLFPFFFVQAALGREPSPAALIDRLLLLLFISVTLGFFSSSSLAPVCGRLTKKKKNKQCKTASQADASSRLFPGNQNLCRNPKLRHRPNVSFNLLCVHDAQQEQQSHVCSMALWCIRVSLLSPLPSLE